MGQTTPDEILSYWIDEIGPEGWYKEDAAVDATIRARFEAAWRIAAGGGLQDWLCSPRSSLAYLILTDQFPRNMFRGEAAAFSTDQISRRAALRAISQGWDLKIAPPERQFFYLPLMHSEVLPDQEQGVRLILMRMPEGTPNLLHARAHRAVIRRFGRFPHRNAALGRRSSAAEDAFLEAGGYGAVVRELQAAAA